MEMKPEICSIIYLLAENGVVPDLMKEAVQILQRNFARVSKLPVFRQFNWTFLKQLLQNNEDFGVTEEEIFEIVMDWVNFGKENRKEYIPEILKLIRLTHMDVTVEY